MWQDFKKFALKGNVIDLAVGVVIGAAFGKIVSSLVDNILMPIVGLLLGDLILRTYNIHMLMQPSSMVNSYKMSLISLSLLFLFSYL